MLTRLPYSNYVLPLVHSNGHLFVINYSARPPQVRWLYPSPSTGILALQRTSSLYAMAILRKVNREFMLSKHAICQVNRKIMLSEKAYFLSAKATHSK